MAARTTRSPRRSAELLGLVVTGVGTSTMLLGIAPAMLQGSIGFLLLGCTLLGAITHGVVTVRVGMSARRAVAEVIGIGLLTFALIYGPMWYLGGNVASQPRVVPVTSAPPRP